MRRRVEMRTGESETGPELDPGRRTVRFVASELQRATAAAREGRTEEARELARTAQAAAARLDQRWLLATAEAARLARRERAQRAG